MDQWGSWSRGESAGILPYTTRDGEVWVLLGCEKANAGPRERRLVWAWCDFGGGFEPPDASAAHTAVREFLEETEFPGDRKARIGALRRWVRNQFLRNDRMNALKRRSVARRGYRCFLVEVPETLFWWGSVVMGPRQTEKRALAWVPWTSVLVASRDPVASGFRIRHAMIPMLKSIGRKIKS